MVTVIVKNDNKTQGLQKNKQKQDVIPEKELKKFAHIYYLPSGYLLESLLFLIGKGGFLKTIFRRYPQGFKTIQYDY